MKFDTVKTECQSLKTIRARWQSCGWPLDRLDGENGILECLDALRNSPLCDSTTTPTANGQTVEQLIEDLEDFYQTALQVWDEFRTVFDSKHAQHELRWPDGTYPASIRQAAQLHFWELVTTTRFSVNDIPCMAELKQINLEWVGLKLQHSVSLAVMVCIKEAIEAFEQIETTDDEQFDEAWEARDQAALWLTHLETLNVAARETDFERKTERTKRKEQSNRAATMARKASTKELTVELVAQFWNERPGQKWETVRDELREKFKYGDKYTVSERTIARRYSKAKEQNLMS